MISPMLALASANVNRIVVQSEVLENEEKEQVIEVGKNAIGNHDTTIPGVMTRIIQLLKCLQVYQQPWC